MAVDSHTQVAIDRAFRVLEAVMRAEFAARDKAMELQAVEYERRLEKLNGEHQTLSSMRDLYLSRDIYQKDQETMRSDRATAIDRAQRLEDQSREQQASNRRNSLGWIAAALIALIGWVITLALHYLPVRGQ